MMIMNSVFFDHRYTVAGGRFSRKFCLDAPRQVIGFDLPAKTGKSGLTRDDGGDDSHAAIGGDGKPGCMSDCVQSSLVNSKTAAPESAKMRSTSQKSALQQLLLPTVDSLSLEPASTKAATAKQATAGAATTTFPVNSIPLPFTASSLPASEDLAKLATRHAFDSTSIYDKHRNRSPALALSERNCVGRIGKKSCQPAEATAIHILAGRSERGLGTIGNWDAEDRLPKGSNKAIRMQEALIEIVRSCSIKPGTDLRRDSVETKWNQTSMHVQNKIKKSSLFMLAATSPIQDYSNQCSHDPGTGFYTPQGMDMEFLNSCYLCKRRVGEGHDIFMYSGDKAFCSMECRYQQIVMDERKERRAPPVIRAGASPAYQFDSKTSNIVINQTRTRTPATQHPITANRSIFTNPAAACH